MVKWINKSMLIASLVSGLFLNTACTMIEKDEKKNYIISNQYETLAKEIDSYIADKIEGTVFVAIGDEIVLSKGYGYADKEKQIPNTMETTFEIGSITKQITASGILQLQEKGLLSVTDTLDKYFPEYKYGKEITIKNLLEMRSGIYNYIDETFEDTNLNKNQKQLEEELLIQVLNSKELTFEPDSQYMYNNTNYYLLALIIEKVSGITYKEYLSKNIFTPCEMNQTTAMVYGGTGAIGYSEEEIALPMPPNLTIGCGDIHSNVLDLYKWDVALLNEKVISKSSLEEMLDKDKEYGYGIEVNGSIISHNGGTLGFSSKNTICKKDGEEPIYIIILTNKHHNNMIDIINEEILRMTIKGI